MPGPRSRGAIATVDDLLLKSARTQLWTIGLPEDGKPGEVRKVDLVLTAIGAQDYDALMAEHPPTKKQKEDEGAAFNPDTFGPALIAAVITEPKLTVEQAHDLWNGKTWNRGEVRDLFMACSNLCAKGLDVPFTPPA
jgi:hypothetical protein